MTKFKKLYIICSMGLIILILCISIFINAEQKRKKLYIKEKQDQLDYIIMLNNNIDLEIKNLNKLKKDNNKYSELIKKKEKLNNTLITMQEEINNLKTDNDNLMNLINKFN